jgi:hypothetical protein
MSFENRLDAGRRLARALTSYRDQHPVILALPRGGVPVAAEVAAALKAPLDLILVRKIGVPIQPELAMGAVVDGGAPIVVRNEDVIRLSGIDESEFKAICDSELAEASAILAIAPASMSRAASPSSSMTGLLPARLPVRRSAPPACASRASSFSPCLLLRPIPSLPCAKKPTMSFAWKITSSLARSASITPISARPQTRK